MGFKDGFVQLFVQLFVQATLWIRQHTFLRSAQTLEVFFDRHLSSATSSMWRPAREIYSIIIFGLVQIFVDLIFDTQSLYEN